MAGIFATAFAGFAVAQTVDELTVVGRRPNQAPLHGTESFKVSYADLNLRTKEGQAELRNRIRISAHYVCEKLGETRQGHSICIDNAINNASADARRAARRAKASHASWTAGPAWTPPPQQ